MSLVTLAEAKEHLRVGASFPDDQVTPYLAAAELSVAQFLNRRVYATTEDLEAAIAAVPDALTAASDAYDAALEAAGDIEVAATYDAAMAYAVRTFNDAKTTARETYAGIVVNDMIKAAVLLLLAHLFENREAVNIGNITGELPLGAHSLLWPYRIGLGV